MGESDFFYKRPLPLPTVSVVYSGMGMEIFNFNNWHLVSGIMYVCITYVVCQSPSFKSDSRGILHIFL
jgi:hypothetical protein